MHVTFFVRECDYFLLYPGGGNSLWWPIREGSARNPGEVLNKYLYAAGRLRPVEVQPLTRRESVLYLRLIPIYGSAGFQQLKGIQSSMQIVKGVPFVNRRYMKSWKMPLPGCYVNMTLGPAHKCCFNDFEFSRIVSCTRYLKLKLPAKYGELCSAWVKIIL